MDLRLLLRMIGILLVFLGAFMLAPLLVALFYGEGDASGIAVSAAITMIVGALFILAQRNKRKEISHREGFAIVTLAWTAAGLFGALPFFLTGTFDSLTDCLFESFSGFTTTGASVMTDIEVVTHGVLFWRSLTHWLGGMGIILFSIAILPLLGVGGMQLYKAEVPGPISEKVQPRVAETAKTLWYVYLLLSAVEFVLLLLGGMGWFDSICHTFGTMATGGFSTKNASIAHYNSVYIDGVITVFMFLAGVNFALHYLALTKNPQAMFRNPEFRLYAGIAVVTIIAFTLGLYLTQYPSPLQALRYAAFQVLSILTTTGYATADFELWPAWICLVLVILMFIGGCAGSTGGGMKVMRIQLLIKSGYSELLRLIHPHAVVPIRFGHKSIDYEVMRGIWNFFFIHLALFSVCSVIMAMMGLDFVSAFTSVIASIGNIGPGLGSVGPTDNFAHIPQAGKVLLMLLMLLGRLEVFTVIVLFVPAFWRR